jgi:hypothetical protein
VRLFTTPEEGRFPKSISAATARSTPSSNHAMAGHTAAGLPASSGRADVYVK